ncbi:hypothetical protein ABT272_41260 [Streptomyces sp900105245]|uniref:Secreted protein n=1 Tax=Streptomyces sp. 900105245 TaxID=3154379 RepID=A0ABV1UKM4_9ACTN
MSRLLVAVWCSAGRFFATRRIIAQALARWGHILLPRVLIAKAAPSAIGLGRRGHRPKVVQSLASQAAEKWTHRPPPPGPSS